MKRSDQRRAAVFALYQREVTGRSLEELLTDAKPFTRELADGVEHHRGEIDAELSSHLEGWTIERVAPLEKSIMRVAVHELRHRDDIPPEVTLDEAVRLAKRYCGSDAPGFVNGVLAATARAKVSHGG